MGAEGDQDEISLLLDRERAVAQPDPDPTGAYV